MINALFSWGWRLALLALLACGLSFSASAQLSTATLSGTITDSTGAAIPGATITLTQTDTNYVRATKSKDDGSYREEFLPVGPYKISVNASGFKSLERSGITLSVLQNADLDLQLQIGTTGETIEVNADVPLINANNSTLGRTISNVEIDNLPLVDRNVYTLLDLTPGVQNNNAAGTGANKPRVAAPRVVAATAANTNFFMSLRSFGFCS